MLKEAKEFIQKLQLEPHPEGGYYKHTYQSDIIVNLADKPNICRQAGSAIYYLLEGNDFSAWHRLHYDEVWHFYYGSTVIIHTIDKRGELQSRQLGNPLRDTSVSLQIAVKANQWIAAEISDKNAYSLVGCTVAPGFEFSDFELATQEELIKKFPQHKTIISKLIR